MKTNKDPKGHNLKGYPHRNNFVGYDQMPFCDLCYPKSERTEEGSDWSERFDKQFWVRQATKYEETGTEHWIGDSPSPDNIKQFIARELAAERQRVIQQIEDERKKEQLWLIAASHTTMTESAYYYSQGWDAAITKFKKIIDVLKQKYGVKK